jgi:hypothetical protein
MSKRPAPYVDPADGVRYYTVQQAAKMVSGVCVKTLWNWASRGGVTSFGFHFDVKRVTLAHHARAYRHHARTHRQTRMLIPETQISTMAEIMREVGKTKPGPWSPTEMSALKAATRRHLIASKMHHL